MEIRDLQKSWANYLRWLKYQPEANVSGTRPVSNAPTTIPTLGGLMSKGYRFKFRNGTKRITILRFLTAKAIYEDIDVDEVAVCYELLDQCLEKCAADANFAVKYYQWLITVDKFCKQAFRGNKFPRNISKGVAEQNNWLIPYLPSKRGFARLKGEKFENSYKVIIRNPEAFPPKKIPTKVIGVGYRDKGHRRDIALDGSPSWEEIAQRDSASLEDLSSYRKKEDKARAKLVAAKRNKNRREFSEKRIKKAKNIAQLKAAILISLYPKFVDSKSKEIEFSKMDKETKDELQKLITAMDSNPNLSI